MRKQGFTLLELLIVVIIIGVMISIGLPQYFRAVERGRSSEALTVVGVLRGSQVRYYAEHGKYTTSVDELDADYSDLKFFNMPTAANDTSGSTYIASAQRNTNSYPFTGGQYTVRMKKTGDVKCTGNANLCTKLGFTYE